MRKFIFVFLGSCILLCSSFARCWEIIQDDENGYVSYIQKQIGTKGDKKCECEFIFKFSDKYGSLTIRGLPLRREGEYVDIQIRIDGGTNRLNELNVEYYGTRTYQSRDNITLMSLLHSSFYEIVDKFTKYEEIEMMVMGNNWQYYFVIDGKLPIDYNEEDIVIFSEDKEELLFIKNKYKTLIKTFDIPKGVKEINAGAFEKCINLESVNIPNTVEKIDFWAFKGCRSLRKINLPKSISLIEGNSFESCILLESVYSENEEIELEPLVFLNCKGLKESNIKNTKIKNGFFLLNNEINSVLNLNMKNVVIPSEITDTSLHYIWLLNYEDIESISIEPLSKIETIDFQNVADRSLKLFRNLKSITCPKSIKLTHVPTTIQVIRN